jgi:hypothetical protein
MKSMAIAALLLCAAAQTHAQSHTMYRCGNVYSQQPCGNGEVALKWPYSSSGFGLDPVKERAPTPSAPSAAREQPQPPKSSDKKPASPPAAVVKANIGKCQDAALAMMKDRANVEFFGAHRHGLLNDRAESKETPGVFYSFHVKARAPAATDAGDKLWACVMNPEESAILKTYQVDS